MKILKATAYYHFYVDIDGLMVDLLSVQIDSSELNGDHGVDKLFKVLIKDHMINLSLLLSLKNLFLEQNMSHQPRKPHRTAT